MHLFVTGSGTDVGKTVVTACLAALLTQQKESFCIYKPVQTGSSLSLAEDLCSVKSWLDQDIPAHCSYCFTEPAAPWVADTEGVILPQKLLQDYEKLASQYQNVLVEGAGGLRVPVTENWDMLDFIQSLAIPAVLVTTPALGSLNHTLLTVEALLSRKVSVYQIIISNWENSPAGNSVAVQRFPDVLKHWLPKDIPVTTLPSFTLKPGFLKDPVILRTISEQLQTNLR